MVLRFSMQGLLKQGQRENEINDSDKLNDKVNQTINFSNTRKLLSFANLKGKDSTYNRWSKREVRE